MELINEILHWVCLYVLLWYGYILLVNKGAPNITTAPAIRKKIIEILKQDAENSGKTPYNIVDMGSGNGAFVRQIAQAIPQAEVTGIDVDPIAHFRACLSKKLGRIGNVHFKRMNFYDYDLSNTNAVVLFQLGSEMPDLRKKFAKELPAGAILTVNRFPLQGEWEPVEKIDVSTLAPNQKELYIYRK